MSIHELKIYFDLNPESKSKILDKYAKKFDLGYFFVDSEDGYCYLFDENGKEKDISLVHEINKNMILDDIQKIVIPDYAMSIGDGAFYKCRSLINVAIPDSVTTIEGYAFYNCSRLKSMMIPNSVTYIGSYTFYNCAGLTSVTIPNSVTSIGYWAFEGCNGLMNVTIGNGIISIGAYAFDGCNLKSIVFKRKTIDQVKSMTYYPFGIEDESIIKAELS